MDPKKPTLYSALLDLILKPIGSRPPRTAIPRTIQRNRTSLIIETVEPGAQVRRVRNRLVVEAASARLSAGLRVSHDVEAGAEAAIVSSAGVDTGGLVGVEVGVVVERVGGGETVGVADGGAGYGGGGDGGCG